MALSHADCAVEAVCPSGHAIISTKALRRWYRYNGFLGSIRSAIQTAKPDFVIPCDDYATLSLHRLYKEHASTNPVLAGLIERSLGAPRHHATVRTRASLLAAAKDLGITVPDTEILTSKQALTDWLGANRLPAYIKADGTSGGVGVRLVESREQAERAFEALSSPPGALRTLKRALIDKDMRLLVPCLRRWRPVVSIQKVISGSEANCAVSCWQGRLLACISAEVIQRDDDYGPATVIRIIDNPEMLAAAEKIASRFQLSGLFGLDFMLEASTGTAYLLEMNARSTQTCHLDSGPGKDPIHAMAAEFSGHASASTTAANLAGRDTIALFPAEWKRDPCSSYLASAYHDVPWEEPELVRYCIKPRLQDQSWMSYKKSRARKASGETVADPRQRTQL
jgi:Carbamoyl-phosphate synthase L chain, ATP binding domain